MTPLKLIVDIDGTICTNTEGDYVNSVPIIYRIAQMNNLYDLGHEIHYWTARGGNSKKDWSELTTMQLNEWGVKYTTLSFNKPVYDLWIDDKAFNADTYFKLHENTSHRL